MSRERWIRGELDNGENAFDWYALAREQGLSYHEARALLLEAMRATSGHPRHAKSLYLQLLHQEREQARIAPGKRTRMERVYGAPSRWRVPTPGVAPGKHTRTMTLAEETAKRRAAGPEASSEPFPGYSEWQATMNKFAVSRELPFRSEMERQFGESLGDILVEQVPVLPRNALAAAQPGRIAFAGASPSKATVAHEVAHVLQYRRGAPRTTARIGKRGDPAEREARHAASAVLAGRSVAIRGAPTAQMHLEDPDEAGEEEAVYEITVTAYAIDFTRRGDGLQVEVMWYALLWQEGRDHQPLREDERPPQFTAPRLRTTRLILRLEEHLGRRMLPEGRLALLERREIPLVQRDPYSYTADLNADDLRQWFGASEWQGFLDGRPPAASGGDPPAVAGEATPTVTVEDVLRRLAEERWDVDDLAAQLTDGQMRSLSATDRVRLIDYISDGFSVLNEDEHTIVRLLATTPPAQALSVRDQLDTRLLQQLDDAIDFDDYRDYNDALRRLFFDSMSPEEAAEQMDGARVFPWANPGLIHSLWNVRFYYDECELRDDGKVHISYWINLAMIGLRTETVQLDPFEMIAVRFFYPEEYAGAEVGETIYMPAINLRSLHRHQFKGELQTAVDIGLLAAGGTGLIGVSTRLARAVAAFDLAISAADLTIRDFRHEIARMEHGGDFLAAWDVVSTLIAAYGVARMVIAAPAAIRRLRRAFERLRGSSPRLPGETMRRIESEVDDVLHQADEVDAASAGSSRPAGTGGSGSVDEAVDASTGQRTTTSSEADGTHTSPESRSRPREREVEPVAIPHGSTFSDADIARLIDDSNPSFRLSEGNARSILGSGPPGTRAQVAGGGGAGADVLFMDASGSVVARAEVKCIAGGAQGSFNRQIGHAARSQARAGGRIWVQVPPGSDGERMIARFRGSRPAGTAKYADVQIRIIDEEGTILYDGPLGVP